MQKTHILSDSQGATQLLVICACGACEFSGMEWDEWVADGKKSPFLGPYVPNDPEAAWNFEVSPLNQDLVKLILPCL